MSSATASASSRTFFSTVGTPFLGVTVVELVPSITAYTGEVKPSVDMPVGVPAVAVRNSQ